MEHAPTIDDIPKLRYRLYVAVWYLPHAAWRLLILVLAVLIQPVGAFYPLQVAALYDSWVERIERRGQEMQREIQKYMAK